MEETLTPVQEAEPVSVQEEPAAVEAEPAAVQTENVEVVDIQFRPGQKIYFFDPDGAVFQTGDHVVMDTARGAEFGICAGGNHMISVKDVVAPLRKILRRATPQDERINSENRSKEKRAYEVCLQKIAVHALDMQLVSAECAFDGSKILFYFTADERVDFRELVKDLASVFHTRIELRQIGVRDKAKMVGGLGICGRPFCCASFLDDFQPVSIKMAKTQNLSLNPTKISGTCGRLMCCLKYEQDTYEDLIRSSPKVDSFVDTPDGRGTVIEAEILRQRVKVQMENSPETIGVYANEDIAILRSGKAKKNDPPIPADLAPISGGSRRPRKPREEENAPMLDPIRFRYSTEAIVEEQPEKPQAEEEVSAPRPRRRRGGQGESFKPESVKPEFVKPEAVKSEAEEPAVAVQPVKPDAPQTAGEENRRPRRPRREQRPQQPRQEQQEKSADNSEKPQKPPRKEQPEGKKEPAEAREPKDNREPKEGGEQPRHRRDNRRRKPREGGEQKQPRPENGGKPRQENAEKAPGQEAAPGAEGGAQNGEKPNRRPHHRPNHHRPHKPKAPQE